MARKRKRVIYGDNREVRKVVEYQRGRYVAHLSCGHTQFVMSKNQYKPGDKVQCGPCRIAQVE